MNAIRKIAVAALLLTGLTVFSQSKKDSLGLPGDNFDLYGALELFKKAESPEAFEKAINSADNEINNLDLDADGKVDYIKVVDKTKGDAHSLVLQVAVSAAELQDVAVIEIEKPGNDKAHVQIVGDEELYGKNYIVEPKDETAQGSTAAEKSSGIKANEDDVYSNGSVTTDNSNRSSSTDDYNNNNNYNNYNNSGSSPVVVNVWAWPSVQYMYGPSYVGWNSPWYWGYYPGWWQPWQPMYWGVYYRRVYHYHYPYYHRVYQHRFHDTHNYYYGQRSASETVRRNNRSGIYNERQAAYRSQPAPRGRRYNNLPAEQGRKVGARDGAIRQNQGVRQGGESPRAREQSPRANPRSGQSQQQPRGNIQSGQRQNQITPQQQPNPSRGNIQPRQSTPRQAAPQARPSAQPRPGGGMQQPRQNAQPAGRPAGGSGARPR